MAQILETRQNSWAHYCFITMQIRYIIFYILQNTWRCKHFNICLMSSRCRWCMYSVANNDVKNSVAQKNKKNNVQQNINIQYLHKWKTFPLRKRWEVTDRKCIIEPYDRWGTGSPHRQCCRRGVAWMNGFTPHTKCLFKKWIVIV